MAGDSKKEKTKVNFNESDQEADLEQPLKFELGVQAAIEHTVQTEDPFFRADFDVTAYLNELFPTEQSLTALDDNLGQVHQRIQEIDNEIADIVQSQHTASEDGQRALMEAKAGIQDLFTRVREIKMKTDSSESMVKEITRDIKQLDTAKKNLMASITTFKNLIFLLTGVENLRGYTKMKNYREIASLLPGIINALERFEKYMNISQIKDLAEQVSQVRKGLAEQTTNDFKELFTGGLSPSISASSVTELCQAVSILDPAVKSELSGWFVQQKLAEYELLFDETQDNAWLDKIDRRFTWFRERLTDVEKNYKNLFPADWEIPRRMSTEFCLSTRAMLDKLIQKRPNEIDVKLLIYAVQKTTNFESLLCKRFPQHEHQIRGCIGRIFENCMPIYMTAQDRNLSALIEQFVSRFREGQRPRAETEMTAVTLPSSGDLFMFYKRSIQQLTSLTTSEKALVDLAAVFKKYLKEYAFRCLTSFLPKINAGQITTTTGLIQSLLKEGDVPRLSNDEVYLTCCILTTAEFCAETAQQLQDKLKEKVLNASWHASLDTSREQETFHDVTTSCIQVLMQDVEAACEPALQAMTKMQWASCDDVGDESRYISGIKQHLRALIPKIRDFMTNMRKHFVQLCLKFVGTFIPRYINCLLRCKPGQNVAGAEQLLLDTHALKTELLNLPSVDSSAGRKPPTAYTKIVMKGMTKAEMLLKAVMLPHNKIDPFVEKYMELLPESDVLEFQKILEMKCVGRADQKLLIETYRQKAEHTSTNVSASNPTNDASNSSRTTNFAAPLLSLASDSADFRIKKLEKLIKKQW